VLRSPIGRTIAAICRDLGISASLCDGTFWNALADSIDWYRGNLGTFIVELKQREARFKQDEWKYPELDLAEKTRAGVRRVLGFFIGEELADSFDVIEASMAGVAAVATGPP
jgi:hypothetical protein